MPIDFGNAEAVVSDEEIEAELTAEELADFAAARDKFAAALAACIDAIRGSRFTEIVNREIPKRMEPIAREAEVAAAALHRRVARIRLAALDRILAKGGE